MHKATAMPHGAMIARQHRNEDENDVNADADRDANRDADRDTNSTTDFQSFDPLVESIDRRLARLRFQNETEVDDCDDSADDAIYQPSDVVLRMHRAPRGIGNTNRLASLLVDPPNGGDNDYVGGLKLFCGFFIIAPFVIWLLLILFWKLRYDLCDSKRSRGTTSTSTSTSTAEEGEKGKKSSHAFDPFHAFHAFKSKLSQLKIIPTPKTATATASSTATVAATSGDANAKTRTPPPTGDPATTKSNSPVSPPANIPLTPWIAGGGVIDMYKLSRAGVSRKDRKRLVLRSWKLQSVFLSVSILIPVLSIVLLERGWKPLEKAALEVQELNNDVEALAYRGEHSIQLLESYKYKLFAENELVRSIVEYSHASINTNTNTHIHAEPDPKDKPKNDGDDDDGSHGGRRAQWGWGWEAGTSAPTLAITSDLDSRFFFPWSDMATFSPTEDEGQPVDENDFNQKAPWKTDSTASPTPTALPWQEEGLNNFAEGANHTTTPLDGFFNHNTSSSTTPSILLKSGIFIDDWCPDAMKFLGIDELNYWADSINNLTEKTQGIQNIFYALETSFPSESSWIDDSVSLSTPPATSSSAFKFVTDTTAYVDESIEWFLANDWLLKLLVLVLNVINGLLLANVYFLSKNNVIHQPTRCYVALVLIPGFVIAAVFVVAVTVATGVGVLINSDFCSGGSDVGGPQGTIEDAILTLQEEQRSQGQVPNQALNLVYDAVDYYWTGCLTENPLEFLEDFSEELDDAVARINEFKLLLPVVDDFDLATNGMLSQPEQNGSGTPGNAKTSTAAPPKISLSVLNKACERDMSFLTPAIHDLKNQVDQIRSNIHMLSDTVSCGQVSPLFRRVSHGAVCVESPEGLAVLWGTSFGIAILCFVLLTVRAALYNSVKYKKRRPTKPRRIVEKEFDEYKEFMGKYYGEKITSEWQIDGIPLPPTKLELEFDDGIDLKGTFDTAKSTKESGSGDSHEDDDDSENAGIFIRSADHEDSSYGSSYDSECSDDEKSSDSENGDEQSSAIGSFLSETKSIAMQTIHSLRNVKSLLSASTRRTNKNTLPPSHVGNLYSNYNTSGDEEEELMDYGNEIFFDNKLDTAVSDIGNDEEEPMEYGNGILHTAALDIDIDVDSDTHDGKSVANSISDASLYLPTPTSQSRNMRSKSAAPFDKKPKNLLTLANDDDFSDEDGVNDEEDDILASHSKAMAKYSLTPTSTNSISVASPTAPRKPLSFLSRTLYTGKDGDGNCSDEELNSLVRPKQLASLKSFRPHKPRDP